MPWVVRKGCTLLHRDGSLAAGPGMEIPDDSPLVKGNMSSLLKKPEPVVVKTKPAGIGAASKPKAVLED